MNIPFFASFILFCLFLTLYIKRKNSQEKKSKETFLDRERYANTVRKQNIDHLEYIQIPFEKFPTELLKENEEIQNIIELIQVLSTQKILNLTGISNTDLKLEYGVANLEILSECDHNFTVLVRNIQKWADILLTENYTKEAIFLMEYAITIRTDIRTTYFSLAKIYQKNYDSYKIQHLIKVAQSLNSIMKDAIVQKLQEFDQYND